MNEARWTLGTLIGVPFVILIIVGCVLLYLYAQRRYWFDMNRRGRYSVDGDGWRIVQVITALIVGVATVCLVFGMYPYKREYHQFQPKEGIVEVVDSRLLGDSDSTTEMFVVRFEGSNQAYKCEDTRCALIQPGDFLSLACKRAWEWAGTDGYDCAFHHATPKEQVSG